MRRGGRQGVRCKHRHAQLTTVVGLFSLLLGVTPVVLVAPLLFFERIGLSGAALAFATVGSGVPATLLLLYLSLPQRPT